MSNDTFKPVSAPLVIHDANPFEGPTLPAPHPIINRAFIESLCAQITRGQPLSSACVLCGVSSASVGKWLLKGKKATEIEEDTLECAPDEDVPYVQLWRAVQEALATLESTATGVIMDGIASGDKQSAMWFLERRFGKNWNKPRTPPAAAKQVEGEGTPAATWWEEGDS